jgi:hypothetical protein
MNNNLNKVIDSISDSINCNLKEQEVLKCYNQLDSAWFFKKKKYKKCQQLDELFKHCLVYANENKLYKREVYRTANVHIDMYNKAIEANTTNKRNSMDYLSGKMNEEEYFKKENPNATKKLVEL